MTELLTPPHPHTPVSYLNQQLPQQQQQQQQPTGTFTGTATEQHPVDLSNSQRPQTQTLLNSPVSSAAFYGLPVEYGSGGNSSGRRADTYKPNGLSLSLGIPDSGKGTHLRNLII